MKELKNNEIESASGGILVFLGLAFGAYQAGKVIGGDIIQYLENN